MSSHLQDMDPASLPLELIDDKVPVVTVRIGRSRPLAFVVDTGAEVNIVNAALLDELGLTAGDMGQVAEPGGAIATGLVQEVTLSIGAHELEGSLVSAPLSFIEPFVGRHLDGILGHPFFSRFVVTIDYAARALSLRPSADPGEPTGQRIPIEVREKDACARVEVVRSDGRGIPVMLELDTASFDVAGLRGSDIDAHRIVGPDQPRIPLLGLAIGGETGGYRTRMVALHLGPYVVDDPVISVVTSEGGGDPSIAGVLGGEVFRRFRTTFDYARQQLLLEPNDRFHDRQALDASGLQLVAEGPRFEVVRVHAVLSDSPAAKAGLHVGDVIESLVPAGPGDLRLDVITRRLREAGAEVTLRMRRGSERRTVPLRLSALL